jgi:hypothetical protein
MNWKRRIPWIALVVAIVSYLAFVEPFVDSMRLVAERTQATTVEERTELFAMGLSTIATHGGISVEPNVESMFRGIYPFCKEITQQSSMIGGPWKGESVMDGLSAIIPRVILPAKSDSNMGNFFSHELGDSGMDDDMQNIAITVPFEIVGNFGWLAGVLSFAAIGAAWATFCASVLTVARMTTHPLTPFVIVLGLDVERSMGQSLNAFKGLPFALAMLCVVLRMTKEKGTAR